MKSSTHRIFSGASIAYIGIAGGSVLGFLFTFLAARFFGPTPLGNYTLAFSYMVLFSLMASLGMQNSILKFTPPSVDQGDWEAAGNNVIIILAFVFSVSILLAGSLYVFSDQILFLLGRSMETSYFRCSLPLLPLLALNLMCYYIFRAIRLIKYESFFKGFLLRLIKILMLFLLIFIGSKNYDPKWLLLLAVLSGELTVLLLCGFFIFNKSRLLINIPRLISEFKQNSRKIIHFSLPLMFAPFLQYGLTQGNILIMGFYLDPKHIGVYRVAFQIAFLLAMLLEAFESVVAPMISENYAKNDLKEMGRNYILSTYWITATTIPFFLILSITANDIMALFGQGFTGKEGYYALIILAAGQMVNAATGTAVYTLILSGRQKIFIANTLFSVIINVILSFLLIPKYGIIGAALATAISIALVNLMAVGQIYLIFKHHPYSYKYIKNFIYGIVTFTLALIGYKTFESSVILNIGITSFLCFAVYASLFFLFGLNQKEKLFIKAFTRRHRQKE